MSDDDSEDDDIQPIEIPIPDESAAAVRLRTLKEIINAVEEEAAYWDRSDRSRTAKHCVEVMTILQMLRQSVIERDHDMFYAIKTQYALTERSLQRCFLRKGGRTFINKPNAMHCRHIRTQMEWLCFCMTNDPPLSAQQQQQQQQQ